jgi:hypothetical protein
LFEAPWIPCIHGNAFASLKNTKEHKTWCAPGDLFHMWLPLPDSSQVFWPTTFPLVSALVVGWQPGLDTMHTALCYAGRGSQMPALHLLLPWQPPGPQAPPTHITQLVLSNSTLRRVVRS